VAVTSVGNAQRRRQLWRLPIKFSQLTRELHKVWQRLCAVASWNILVFCNSSCGSSVAATRTLFIILYVTKQFSRSFVSLPLHQIPATPLGMPSSTSTRFSVLITFGESHRGHEMYSGHGRLCVCLSLAVCPLYCTYPDVTWEEWQVMPPVLLLWQHTRMHIALYTANAYSAEREMSASACTRCVPGWYLFSVLFHQFLLWFYATD